MRLRLPIIVCVTVFLAGVLPAAVLSRLVSPTHPLVAAAILCAFWTAALVTAWLLIRPITNAVDTIHQDALNAQSGVKEPLTPTGISELDNTSTAFTDRIRNLTDQLAAERDFAADVSHQLRTPLTAMMIRLEEITEATSIETAQEEAGHAIEQVERLVGVVDGLLSRARHTEQSSAHGPTPAGGAVSLDTVLASLQREWLPTYAKSRRPVHIAGTRGLWVACDVGDLGQLLSTLLENALQHGQGTVHVDARRSGPSVVVEVSDEGIGIEPSFAARIFERRVSSSGSGLGLALARDLASANGGRLELRSASPAVFALFLSEARPPVHDQPLITP